MMVNGKEVARTEERSMNAVIVAAAPKVSRTYYAGVYKKGVASAPDCWSADGEVPDAKAKNPQSKACKDCPQNIKGSGQGDSRARRFSQRLAVVLENDISGDVYQLTLPSQSVFGEGEPGKWPLQTYAKMIGSKGVPITSVVTEMRFDKVGAFQFSFEPGTTSEPLGDPISAEVKQARYAQLKELLQRVFLGEVVGQRHIRAFGIAGVTSAIKDTLSWADDLADTADRVGLTTDSIQALRAEAKLFGVTAEEVDGALTKFSINLGKARNGTGELAAVFKQYNQSLSGTATEVLGRYFKLLQQFEARRNRIVLRWLGSGQYLGQFFKKMALVLVEVLRGCYDHSDEQVSSALAVNIWDSLALAAKGLPILSARWYSQIYLPI